MDPTVYPSVHPPSKVCALSFAMFVLYSCIFLLVYLRYLLFVFHSSLHTYLFILIFRLADLDRRDKEKNEREQARNSLESHVFETQDALYTDAVIQVSTESERESVSQALSEASDWLYDEGDEATTDVYKQKLKDLKQLSKGMFSRVKEMLGRPEAIAHLKQTMNLSEIFLSRILNVSEDEQIYTEVEIQALANVTKDTKASEREVEIWCAYRCDQVVHMSSNQSQ